MRYIGESRILKIIAYQKKDGVHFGSDMHISIKSFEFIHSNIWEVKKWHIVVENQIGIKLKVLRIDIGLKFISKNLMSFV